MQASLGFSAARMAAFLSLLLLGITAMACGSSSDRGSQHTGREGQLPQRTPSASNRSAFSGEAVAIERDRVAQILADPEVSESVRAAVEDGALTFAEYEAAVLSLMSCFDGAGINSRAHDPVLNSRGLYVWSLNWQTALGDRSEALLGCLDKELGILDLIWKEHVAPSERDVQEAMKQMADCLVQAGLADQVPTSSQLPRDFQIIPRNLTVSGRDAQIPDYVACARSAQDNFGLIGFIGESPE